MDELLKVPPVTRTIIGLVLGVSLPPLLGLASPYNYLLWWPAVLKQQQVWRVATCFFLSGGGIQMVFDLFMLGRNIMELEVNHFHRSTADLTWALMVISSFILATNYPLQSTVLFNPFLMAVNYLWSRANPTAVVSLFGLVSCPAALLPYAYLSFDLIRGGLPLFVQSSTGLLSAFLYYQLRHTLPSNGGPRSIPTPAWLQRLLPPSVDPANAAAQAARNAAAPGGRGGQVLGFGGGTMFAPRGRSIGDSSSNSHGSTSGSSGSRQSWFSYLPSFLRGGGGGGGGTAGSSSNRSTGTSIDTAEQARKRAALLEATERRLRAQREKSIAGRNTTANVTVNSSSNSSSSSSKGISSSTNRTETMTSSSLPGGRSTHSTALPSSQEAQGGNTRARTTVGAASSEEKAKAREEE